MFVHIWLFLNSSFGTSGSDTTTICIVGWAWNCMDRCRNHLFLHLLSAWRGILVPSICNAFCQTFAVMLRTGRQEGAGAMDSTTPHRALGPIRIYSRLIELISELNAKIIHVQREKKRHCRCFSQGSTWNCYQIFLLVTIPNILHLVIYSRGFQHLLSWESYRICSAKCFWNKFSLQPWRKMYFPSYIIIWFDGSILLKQW